MTLNFGSTLFPSRSEYLASYDYQDIAAGIGYETLYGARTNGTNVLVSSSSIYSDRIRLELLKTKVTSNYKKNFDEDFLIEFNSPRIINGKLIANVPIGVAYDGGGLDDGAIFYTEITAYKVSGGVETQIGAGTSAEITADLDTDDSNRKGKSSNSLTSFNIDNQHFKIGDSLKINVAGWFKDMAGETPKVDMAIGIDPAARRDSKYSEASIDKPILVNGEETDAGDEAGFGFISTRMSFNIPFKIIN